MIAASDLVDEVLSNLELDGNIAANLTRFKVYDNLSAVQRFLIRQLPLTEIDTAIKTVKFNLTTNVVAIQWPSDYARFVKLWMDFTNPITDINQGRLLTEAKNGEFNIDITDYQPTTEYPKFEFIEGGFAIRPIPSSSVTNGGRLRHVQQLPKISAAQDSLLREDLRNLMVYRGTALCAMVDDYSPDISTRFNALFVQEGASFWGDNKVPGVGSKKS